MGYATNETLQSEGDFGIWIQFKTPMQVQNIGKPMLATA